MAYKPNEGHKMVVHHRNTQYGGARPTKIHTKVAFVRVIISIFMKLVVRGLLLANELFYQNKMCIVYYSCGALVAILRTYITHPSIVRVHLSSVEDNEELQPKVQTLNPRRVRVPTTVVKKWAVGGDTSLGELIFGVFGFATKEPNLVSSKKHVFLVPYYL